MEGTLRGVVKSAAGEWESHVTAALLRAGILSVRVLGLLNSKLGGPAATAEWVKAAAQSPADLPQETWEAVAATVNLLAGTGEGLLAAARAARMAASPRRTTSTAKALCALSPRKRPIGRLPVGAALPQVDRLREAELSRKHKAVAELKRMVAKAGQHSRLAARLAKEYGEDSDRLLEAVLAKGAASTIECHLLRWRAMEKLASGREQVYPLKACAACKYLMHKDDERCGPSVPEALKATVLWVSRRLEMDIPDMDTPEFVAIKAKIIEQRGTELKEAKALPLQLVAGLEAVAALGHGAKAHLAWYTLCMVYASLRYDDAMHVVPTRLRLEGGDLHGTSWQTKTDRTRKGVQFAVPDVSTSGHKWLGPGLERFRHELGGLRDYWMPNIALDRGTICLEHGKPMHYQDSLKAFRALLVEVGAAQGLMVTEKEYSWHSCKATMINQAARQEESGLGLALQGHWKDPNGKMPLKYARARMAIPLAMIKRVVQKNKDQQPAQATWSFVQSARAGSIADMAKRKIHIVLGQNARSACRRTSLAESVNLGTAEPPEGSLCAECVRVWHQQT
jgi:hypothetical protein